MFGRALAALLTIASTAIFSRLLTPNDYGVLTLTITSAGIFNALFCTWVAQSVFRLYPEVQTQTSLQSTGLLALTVSAFISGSTALVTIALLGKSITGELAVGITLLFTGFSFYEYCNIQLTAQQRPFAFAQLQLARLLLGLFLPLGAWFITKRLDYLILGLGASYWLPLLLPRFTSWMSGVAYRNVDWTLLRTIARYGLPLSCALLLFQLGIAIDRYILGAYHGAEAVAGYAAGADLALFAIGMIASSISQAFYPRLLQLRTNQENDADEELLYAQYISFFVAAALPAAVGLYFVADEITWLIVGPAIQADASSSLMIFAATAFILNFRSFIVDVRFQIAKKMLFPIISAFATLALVAILGVWQIPSNAASGAAWSSMIAIACGCLIATLASIVVAGKPPINSSDLLKILAAVGVMAIALYAFDNLFDPLTALAIKIVSGMIVYGAVLFVLNYSPVRNGVELILRAQIYRSRM